MLVSAIKKGNMLEAEERPAEPQQLRDDEGLLLEYDVIICGTGLVQAILASALARAGKSVLHCDRDDSYGELDAVWSLSKLKDEERRRNDADRVQPVAVTASRTDSEAILCASGTSGAVMQKDSIIHLSSQGGTATLQFHSMRQKTCHGIHVGTRVRTPFGTGTVHSIPNGDDKHCNSVAVALDCWKLADGTVPLSYFGLGNTSLAVIMEPVALEEHLAHSHGVQSIASIRTKEMLLNSRTFALDASPVYVYAAGRAVDGMLASNVADYLEFKTVDALFWFDVMQIPKFSRVPCSKKDVFTTNLLSPMDKRRLMKFLQLSMDFATQMTVTEQLRTQPQSSLALNTVEALADEQVQSLNERHLNQGRSLARPQNKAVAAQDLTTLQDLIKQRDVTLDHYLSEHHNLSHKLRSIIRHALALETSQQPSSLFSGMKQLRHHLQALGRFGTTAFLVPMYGSGELSQAFCRSAAVFGATYLLRRAPTGIVVNNNADNTGVQGILLACDSTVEEAKLTNTPFQPKTVRSTHVVVPTNALLPTKDVLSQRVLRRISLINGTLVPGDQRHAFIIPPFSIDEFPRTIHGISMDHTIQVAPRGCTILHLTTTISSDDVKGQLDVLDSAAETMLKVHNTGTEFYAVNFSYVLRQIDPSSYPKGVHVCSPCGQVLTADVAFEQAEGIFKKICPGKQFLGLSEKFDATIKQLAIEQVYQDEERQTLESALELMRGKSLFHE